ncbi:hypothetical protein QYE76_041137 [Lolium multiflorum]|uniref:Uncharacterized protein n=1 Tax=Lolium multiflorum TaxID=4521 RepID=A0AAD8TCT0_LOLMU|nr:hypothetical protein QYE76_041137 [Lolium multiflorum]
MSTQFVCCYVYTIYTVSFQGIGVEDKMDCGHRNRIYLRGTVRKELLTSNQFVHLSKKIKKNMRLQQQISKKEKYGNEQSYKDMAQCSEYQQRTYCRGELAAGSYVFLFGK